ncbi:MAG TPA: hypothetical protein VMV72_13955 [Verrucomicrobiae bacterium]|nr:hypothetical protein [Verrucomicrobiae bacterium]
MRTRHGKTFGLCRVGGLLIVTTVLLAGDVRAQTNSWTYPSGGYWDDFRNWSLGIPPASSQAVLITNAPTKLVTIDAYTAGSFPASMTVTSLTLSADPGVINMLSLSDAGTATPLSVQDSLMILSGGALTMDGSALQVGGPLGGSFLIEGIASVSGTNSFAGGVYVGYSTNSTGALVVTGGQSMFTNGYTAVGFYGSGDLELPNGMLQIGDSNAAPNGIFVGLTPGAQGTVHFSGGTLLAPDHLSIGDQSNTAGAVWITGGQVALADNYLTTVGADGIAQLVVSNAQLAACSLIAGSGSNSVGTLTVAGGTTTLSGGLMVGEGLYSTGNAFLSGGQLVVTNLDVVVGNYGVGQMTISNGILQAQGVSVGSCTGSVGLLTVAGGTVSASSNIILGAFTNGVGAMQIANGSVTVTNQSGTGSLVVGQSGVGTLAQNGGVLQVDQLAIASGSGSNLSTYPYTLFSCPGIGQVSVSNGLLQAGSILAGYGTNSPGALNLAGGQTLATSNVVAGVSLNASGSIQVSGGSFFVTNQSGTASLIVGQAGKGNFTQSGGSSTVDRLLAVNGTNSTITLGGGTFSARSATVSNSQALIVGNGATYHLLGGVHTFANGVYVASGGTLSGCGTIIGNVGVNSGGTVLSDCGTLTFMNGFYNVGTVRAINGTTLAAYGSVTNIGVIDAAAGQTNFQAGVDSSGVILTSDNVPHILAISMVGSNAQITFTMFPNQQHTVEYTDDLSNPNWMPLTSFISGSAGVTNILDSGAATVRQRFYRVHLEVSIPL